MLVVTETTGNGLVLTEVRIWDRIAARLRSHSLDNTLASCTDPESTVTLAVRAHTLTRPHVRRYLARSLERILTEATRPTGLRPTLLTPERRRVIQDAADDLNALITRLRSAGPVTACGIAQVVVLLSDGGGPLHTAAIEPDLRTAIEQALTHLDDPAVIATRLATSS
jgi:hypothetical protein